MKKSILKGVTEIAEDACFEIKDGLASCRRSILGSNYMIFFAEAITTGTFFNAFMLLFGADAVVIGYATMITTFCSIIQFIAPFFWERVPKRKPIMISMIFAYNFLKYGAITLIPVLPASDRIKLTVYFILALITAVMNNFYLPAKNAWTMQSIPLIKRVNFTSVNSLAQTVINVITTFLAGVFLDRYAGKTLTAIFILRGSAMIVTTVGTVLLATRVREFAYPGNGADTKPNRRPGYSLALVPLKNKPFMLSVLVPCVWALICGIIGNFFTLHLIENVKMSYTLISSANMISTPLILLLTPVWTLILKDHNWVRSLSFAFIGYSTAYLSNVFISAKTPYFYFIAIVLGQLFMPCITMVNNNMIYLHMPEESRTAYFGFYTFLSGLCTFAGQALGTLFVKYTPGLTFQLFGIPVCNLQLTSAIAVICTLLLALYCFRLSNTPENNNINQVTV